MDTPSTALNVLPMLKMIELLFVRMTTLRRGRGTAGRDRMRKGPEYLSDDDKALPDV